MRLSVCIRGRKLPPTLQPNVNMLRQQLQLAKFWNTEKWKTILQRVQALVRTWPQEMVLAKNRKNS